MRIDNVLVRSYQVGLWHSRAYRSLNLLTESYLSDYNLTPIEWAFMGILYESPDGMLSHAHLAGALGTSAPFVTKLTQKLLDQKLVTQTLAPSDQRKKYVTLSLDGRQFVDRHERGLMQFMKLKLEHVSPLELRDYVSTLQKIG